MVRIYEGWQCVGCGKIDVDRPCIGVCRDRPVRIVLESEFAALEQRNSQLESVLRRFLHATPHPDAWERSWKALHKELAGLMKEELAPSSVPTAPILAQS